MGINFITRNHTLITCWSKQIGEVVTTIPTIGFNVESVTYRNLNFNVWVSFGNCRCEKIGEGP